MPREIRWKIPLIVIVIAIAIMAIYPPFEKPFKKERIKEVDGKVVEREIIDRKWVGFFVSNPVITETVLNETTDSAGSKTVEKVAEYKARGQVKLGLDLKGGSELLYGVRVNKNEDRTGLTKEIIEVLKKRIDPQGILEYRIQEQGSHRILIQVPGATRSEIEALKLRLTRLGKLEFRLAAPGESSEYKAALRGESVPGYYKHWIRKVKGEEGETNDWFLVRNKTEITGEHLARVFPERKDVQAVVGFEFDQVGKAKFGKLTERNIGKPLAIILDGVLYSAPSIRDRIPGKGIIEGGFSQQEVNDLIAVMRAGSLPADLELEMETTVGPSLGQDSITKGLRAGLIGSIFVLLFMGIFYLGVGWVANFALALNILLILGALVIVSATVTLPGLAGLVLTVGIAVDANVLIFERIREEKRSGKSIKMAVKNGYERAFTTILDANLTTLITAVILAAVGTGPVKGFAWVLIVGLLVNMFTSIFVTRTIFSLFTGKKSESFHMLNFFSNTNYSFVSFRRIAIPVSIFLIVGGLTIFGIRGNNNYDIDFTGGTLVHLQLKSPKPVKEVRDTLRTKGYSNVEVQGIWLDSELAEKKTNPSGFGIRIKELDENKINEKISSDLKKAFANQNLNCDLNFEDNEKFTVSTNKPVEESVLQNALTRSGYRDDDIRFVEPSNTKSRYFEAVVAISDDKSGHYNMLKNIADNLTSALSVAQVDLTFRDIKDPSESGSSRSILDVDVNRQIDPTLLEIELNRSGFGEINVYKRDSSRRALSTKLEIRGSKGVLQEIKNKMNKSLQLPSISFVNNNTVRIELKAETTESVLRKEIGRVSSLDESMKKLITINAEANLFVVNLNPLRTGKIQEKIQDDIVSIFKKDLYSETIKVGFSQGGANSDVANNDADAAILQLNLSVPVEKERIETILNNTGYTGLLSDDLIDGKAYKTVEMQTNKSEIGMLKEKIASAFVIPMPLKRIVSIGSSVAGEMRGRAILALIFACFAIILYVWYRFGEFKFGAAAVIALIHDVTITLGAVAVADHFGGIFGDIKLNLPMVAAFLTLVGYSLNDTIVLFDRIRENVGGKKSVLNHSIVNLSINQNLNRTVITSLTTLGVLLALYFVGGPEIHGFAFVMIVGVIVGTYSSIFIASPILVKGELKDERKAK